MKKNIVVINRWSSQAGGTRFQDLIDHEEFQVHYLLLKGTEDAISVDPAQVASLRVLEELDFCGLRAALDSIIQSHGPLWRLIAMAEKDLLAAGRLRDHFAIQGMGYHQATRFIDKSVMKGFIERAGIPTPRFRELSQGAGDLRFPLILKPKAEAGSRGVQRIFSPEELRDQMPGQGLENFLLEEYCPDQVYHLDGFVHRGEIVFQCSNQYIGTCLDHAHGEPLGSVVVTDPEQVELFRAFAMRVVRALELDSGTFHLECFLTHEGPVFLELGARAGGGDIRELIELIYGFNIVRAWIDVQLGREPKLPMFPSDSRSAGFMAFPAPRKPSLLVQESSLAPDSALIKEYRHPTGHRFPGGGDIFTNSVARFLFKGSECEVRESIATVRQNFRATFEVQS